VWAGSHRGIVATMTSDDVGRLRRWEDAGALWRVVARTGDGVEIALLTCDAGEVVDRFRSADPELLDYVGDTERHGPKTFRN
jgi:hypothetical protein